MTPVSARLVALLNQQLAQFGDRPDLVARCKDLRQRLGQLHHRRYKLARHTADDPAAGLGHPAQAGRHSPEQVLAVNAGRVQEALRVLEEFGRGVDPPLAAEAAAIRYSLYDLEVALLRAGPSAAEELRRRLARCRLYLVTSPVPELEHFHRLRLQLQLKSPALAGFGSTTLVAT